MYWEPETVYPTGVNNRRNLEDDAITPELISQVVRAVYYWGKPGVYGKVNLNRTLRREEGFTAE